MQPGKLISLRSCSTLKYSSAQYCHSCSATCGSGVASWCAEILRMFKTFCCITFKNLSSLFLWSPRMLLSGALCGRPRKCGNFSSSRLSSIRCSPASALLQSSNSSLGVSTVGSSQPNEGSSSSSSPSSSPSGGAPSETPPKATGGRSSSCMPPWTCSACEAKA